jgi:virginiamycin B lyase
MRPRTWTLGRLTSSAAAQAVLRSRAHHAHDRRVMGRGWTASARRAYVMAALAVIVVSSSCAGGDQDGPRRGASPPPASPSPPPDLVFDLPKPSQLEDIRGVEAIRAEPFPDFMVFAFGRVWVGGVDDGVGVYDAATGEKQGSVELEEPCMAMDAGFGAVWSGTCAEPGIARIDPMTMRVTDRVDVPITGDGESSVAVGEGAVWAVSDAEDCTGCRLVRIDPSTMEIADAFEIPEGAAATRAAFGAVWVTVPLESVVLRIDPATGEIEQEIPTGLGPRFLAVGEGAVWVMTSSDGGVAHIDPRSNAVVASIGVDSAGIQGGDIAVGEGSVWLRDNEQLVARIDPSTDRVIEWIGPSHESGSVAAGKGNLWISAFDDATIYRVPLNR